MILGAWVTHHEAPTGLLERFALTPDQVGERLDCLKRVQGVQEGFILSTCNRVEYYASLEPASDPAKAASKIGGLLVTPPGAASAFEEAGEPAELRDLVIVSSDATAARHLLAVACGLDSIVLGEHEIVAQFRAALQVAEAQAAIGHVLGNLVRAALRTSKRVRTQTALCSAGTSMVSVGLNWSARQSAVWPVRRRWLPAPGA